MAKEKEWYGRIQHKYDIEVNWKKAVNFIPLEGELIIYGKDENFPYDRFKVGDGTSYVNDLPFVFDLSNYYTQEEIVEISAIILAETEKQLNDHNTDSQAHIDIREAISAAQIDNIISNKQKSSIIIFANDINSASGKHAIAVGTDDKSAINGIVGDTLAAKITIDNPSAEGEASIAAGGSARAISASDIAIGPLTTAGVKGYYWSNITFNEDGSAVITLSTKQDKSSAPNSIDWKTGDVISIVNDTQYPACAKVTGVSGANITVDKLPFREVESVASKKPDDNTVFACYKKEVAKVTIPIVGTVLAENYCWYPRNGEVELAWVATAFGVENLVTGSGSIVAGYNNWQAGNFGATFGRENIGGYGNVIGGGWNKSIGLHSAIFGRDHENYGDYNFQSGRITKIESGDKNTISGEYSVIRNGKYNDVSGYNNLVENSEADLVGGSTNKVKAGAGHLVGGKQNTINSGYYDVVGGSEHQVNGDQNAVFGKKHNLKEKSDLNIVGGLSNTIENSQHNIVGGSGHIVKNHKNIVGGSDNTVATNNNIVGGSVNNIKVGHSNIVSGNSNTIENSTFSAIAGNLHSVHGDQVNVSGKGHTLKSGSHFNVVGGETNTLSASKHNIVGGKGHTLTNSIGSIVGGADAIITASYVFNSGQNNILKNGFSATIGYGLETSAANQVVIGQYNDPTTTSNDLFVAAFGSATEKKNVLTIPRDGLAKKGSDAITLDALNKKLADIDVKAVMFDKCTTDKAWGPEKVAYGNGRFVGVRGDEVGYSTDGLNWTVTTKSDLGNDSWKGIVYNDKLNCFLAGSCGDQYIIISNDFEISEYKKLPYPSELMEARNLEITALMFDGTRFVITTKQFGCLDDGTDNQSWEEHIFAYWSTDGDNWEYSIVGRCYDDGIQYYDKYRGITSIAYNNGIYVAFSSYELAWDNSSFGRMYYSTDLATWSIIRWTQIYNDSPEYVIPTTRGFFACDADWHDAWYSINGIDWQYLGLVDARGCVAAACSPDGKIISITKDGKAFIYDENNLPDADTVTSGIRIDRTLEADSWSDIIYADGKFCVTKRNFSLVSTDGINWTRLHDSTRFVQDNEDITSDVLDTLSETFIKRGDNVTPDQIIGDGTINGKLHIKGAGIPLTVQSTNADTVFVQFCNSNREIIGHLGVGNSGPYYRQGINTTYHKLYHEGNINTVLDPKVAALTVEFNEAMAELREELKASIPCIQIVTWEEDD